ncbi:MAG: hypothetical protein U9N51_12100 [Bacteroidota bacterium]|nr:hypothetical protein [Bacteroidota bacterium]
MMKLKLFILLLIIPAFSNAQVSFKVFSNPSYTYYNNKEFRRPVIKNSIGVNTSFSKKEKIKYWFGINLVNRGWKDEFSEASTSVIKWNFLYLELPFIMEIKLIDLSSGDLYLETGLAHGVLLKHTKENEDKSVDLVNAVHGDFNSSSLFAETSIYLGLGYKYHVDYDFLSSIEIQPNYYLQMYNYNSAYSGEYSIRLYTKKIQSVGVKIIFNLKIHNN